MQRAIDAKAAASQAEIYDARFVPALFAGWGPVVAKAAGAGPGDVVLDVGCGTGALTAAAAAAVGPEGAVVGLDANPEMLAVARRKPFQARWREGRAEALPFEDAAFDAVMSQFACMFFDDRLAALREMLRVLKPGGCMAVAVCDGLDRSPAYAAFADLLQRLFGQEVRDAFAAPFVLGDMDALQGLAVAARLPAARVWRRQGKARFASIADLVSAERACAWTLGGLLDDSQFQRLAAAAETALAAFTAPDGAIEFDMPALVLTAEKPGRMAEDRLTARENEDA
ncbi:MAG: methyltransferase domain-containing protein [Alphaproteobacteria bacterium]